MTEKVDGVEYALRRDYILRRKWSVEELKMIEDYVITPRAFRELLVWIDQLPIPDERPAP